MEVMAGRRMAGKREDGEEKKEGSVAITTR
jgi:hypothetical protein